MKIKHLAVANLERDDSPFYDYRETALYDMDTQERIYFATDVYEEEVIIDDDIISANELARIIKHVFDWQDEGYTDLDVINIEVDSTKYDNISSYMEEVFNELNKNNGKQGYTLFN